jgi:hypothetical protein
MIAAVNLSCPKCCYVKGKEGCTVYEDRRLCRRYRDIHKIKKIMDPTVREKLAKMCLTRAVSAFIETTQSWPMRYCQAARWENTLASLFKTLKKNPGKVIKLIKI